MEKEKERTNGTEALERRKSTAKRKREREKGDEREGIGVELELLKERSCMAQREREVSRYFFKSWGSFNGCISLLRLSQLGIHNIIYFLKNLLAWDSNHGLLTPQADALPTSRCRKGGRGRCVMNGGREREREMGK